jgi:hypothetical protein
VGFPKTLNRISLQIVKNPRSAFSNTASLPRNTHIKVCGMQFAFLPQRWFGVDSDACRIGPRLVTAFRRRGSMQPFFTSFDRRAGLSRPCGDGLCCAHENLSRFSRGAPQALTIVGHNSAQSKQATTDRSGSIAMDPAVCLPSARSPRIHNFLIETENR